MMGLRPEDRPTFVSSFRDCRTPEFVELMIGLARDVRATRPQEAAKRVRLGLVAVDAGLDCDREQLARSRAAALRELGNADRLTGNFERATHNLDEAARALVGVHDPDQVLEIQGIQAQILEVQNEVASIDALWNRGLVVSLGASKQSIGLLHLSMGSALARFPEKSLLHLETALNMLTPALEPKLIGNVFHGLGQCLIRLGYIDEGIGFLRRSLAIFNRWGSTMDRIRVLWLGATADQRRNGWTVAEEKLQNVVFLLTNLGQPITTGLAFLDLSRTLAQRGGWLQAESAALKATSIFAECRNERYLTASESVLTHAGSTRRRSVSRIDELVEDLW